MKPLLLGLIPLLLATSLSRATVRMPALFGDHMVLQQAVKVPVWGTTLAGETVNVTLGDHTGSAVADADGKWRVDLKPFPANAAPMTLTVKGASNTLTFQDVVIGEVWVASGQSNMEVPINWMPDAAQIAAASTDTQLRKFFVEHNPYQATSLTPRDDVTGHWAICDPGTCNNYSAVSYFFGRELRAHLKQPVGIIDSYVGGTPASSWISLSGLMKAPAFPVYVDKFYDAKVSAVTFEQNVADTQYQMNLWSDQYLASIAHALTQWKSDSRNAEAGNNAQGNIAQVEPPPNMPRFPDNPAHSRYTPTVLFNGMIAPLMPYAIKGVIWYQGEDNGVVLDHAHEYATLFPRLITDWREKWGEGDFPFLYVQLASFTRDDIGGPGGFNFAVLRESQAKTLSLPKTGMVTAIDIGAGTDIHPKDKLDVGKRLALAARHVAYGEDLVYTGPTYDKMAVEGGTIRVSFTNIGGGLLSAAPPWHAPNVDPTPASPLLGFTIAGADKKFVAADAKVDGSSVIVSSAQVPNPVAVRYYWDNLTQANLYNKEGLPAFPFRSDTWDDVPSPANPPGMH
jgi:sialate O-acetylesterase